jgi:hypothetical protein
MERIDRDISRNRFEALQHSCRDRRLDDSPLCQHDSLGAIDGERSVSEASLNLFMERVEDNSSVPLIGKHTPRSRFAAFGTA